ncbi:site-specific integrase [Actinacidiphila acididurans]|uniref:Site-specific integrase n=1 Tax=Actinacidiphila acididurans TaxID=2784346 RepID=A0ABS2TTZ8_9ACTN|nr:site-specific integrase [Actinacidiphila acididurans]MBM9506815.1 site-specific integrase [Actinacidiphila acididurans]
MLTFDVRVYKLRIRSGRRRPFTVRWRVGDRDHSESYQFEAQADGRRAELMTALRLGEQFDTFTGLPVTELRARNTVTWFEHAVEYAAVKWPRVSAKHRAGIADALATVTMALVRPSSGQAPPALRRALLSWAFRMVRGRDGTWTPRMKVEQAPAEVARGLEWIARHSLSLAEAARPHRLRAVLAAVSRRMDGSEAAENTVRRKRIVLSNALVYAVSCERLQANPLPKVDWQPPLTDIEVDFRYVPGPRLARDLIIAVGTQGLRGAHLEAFFGCLYYAAMRPAEAAALNEKDCLLPGPHAAPEAWGELVLARSHPEAGSGWTDDGRPHDTRGLKRRARNATRSVPIPPDLVRLLRAHLQRYGTAPDGRLFRAVRGGRVPSTEYCRIWATARRRTLLPRDAETPFAKVPYCLRHAGISLWITAGIPPAEAARRAGHSLTVLYRIYAKPLRGHQHHANQLITAALQDLDQDVNAHRT